MTILPENNPALKSFIPVTPEHHFPIQNLPFGVFFNGKNSTPRIGVAIGDFILDLDVLEKQGFFTGPLLNGHTVFQQQNLNPLMALGRLAAREARTTVSRLLREDEPTLRDNPELRQQALVPRLDATMLLPAQIGGYTDFYSSMQHAINVGKMFRPSDTPLLPNWPHMPIAYDGRSSAIVVSGTPFHRPMGQIKPDDNAPPVFAPCQKLDIEMEVAFFVGQGNEFGQPIPMNQTADHIFGMVLLNDWSARDIQKWEYVPLGPFLGKNFCTSISPWVVTLDALLPFAVKGPIQEPTPLPYLQAAEPWHFNIQLAVQLQTQQMTQPETIATMNFQDHYWSCCQQLAHHTSGGCKMNPGDLLASGTVSGPTPDAYGSLLELTWAGKQPLQLSTGEKRVFLADYDEIIMTGWCQGAGYRIGFGEVSGQVLPEIGKAE